MARKEAILVDTMVIIESHQSGCWNALSSRFRLETVEKCIEETATGKQKRRPEQQIDETELRSSFHQIHPVTDEELAEVYIRGASGLDDGERHLWAHALGRPDAWVLCGPDRASMRFGFDAKFRDRLISLEQLCDEIGHRARLREHFQKRWLEDVLLQLTLGKL